MVMGGGGCGISGEFLAISDSFELGPLLLLERFPLTWFEFPSLKTLFGGGDLGKIWEWPCCCWGRGCLGRGMLPWWAELACCC